jgi:predicted RecB family nuclease
MVRLGYLAEWSGLDDVSDEIEWDVDDPGGAESMLRYDIALGNSRPGDEEGRDWLLTYNRNDVEATAALRNWLDSTASACPPIESLER